VSICTPSALIHLPSGPVHSDPHLPELNRKYQLPADNNVPSKKPERQQEVYVNAFIPVLTLAYYFQIK
jgi:hypothetical protein